MKPLTEICGPAVKKDDANWLEENYPELFDEVRTAVLSEHKPRDIYLRYMQMAPNRQPLWLRCKHAAEHFETVRIE